MERQDMGKPTKVLVMLAGSLSSLAPAAALAPADGSSELKRLRNKLTFLAPLSTPCGSAS